MSLYEKCVKQYFDIVMKRLVETMDEKEDISAIEAIKLTIDLVLNEVLALAPTMIEEIINELKDRRGLSQEWDMIDRDLQDEIRAEWTKIIQEKVTELKNND